MSTLFDEILTTDQTAGYHGGNPESVAAFASTSPAERKAQLDRIVDHIKSLGNHGATCDEVELALGLSHQTCSARFVDGKRAGLLVSAGVSRPTRTGRKAGVFVEAVGAVLREGAMGGE